MTEMQPDTATQPDTTTQPEGVKPLENSSAAKLDATTFAAQLREVQKSINDVVKYIAGEIWRLKVPLGLLAAIAAAPKVILVWLLAVLVKPVATFASQFLPPPVKTNLETKFAAKVERIGWLRDLNEGMDQGRPFVLAMLYLCCLPFSVAWMAVHWCKGIRRDFKLSSGDTIDSDALVFAQNAKQSRDEEENNFVHSRAFGAVTFALFGLGLPALFSLLLYNGLRIDGLIQATPSSPPIRQSISVGQADAHTMVVPKVKLPQTHTMNEYWGDGSKEHGQPVRSYNGNWVVSTNQYNGVGATVVTGYNGHWTKLQQLKMAPTMSRVFWLDFYFFSLAFAMSALFFRAWFTFPLNFLRDTHKVELTETGVKCHSHEGWFYYVTSLNNFARGGPTSLPWSEVQSLRHFEEGFTRLYPLPETVFKRETLVYKLLNKMAAFFDSLSNHAQASQYLVFSAGKTSNDLGRNIKINLRDLNRQQRAKLFYAVKTLAPHVEITREAETKLLGSCVLRGNRYTQIWFDLLTSKNKKQRQAVLSTGDVLKDKYTVERRISAGGQATAYLAKREDGSQCVLKEFILATSAAGSTLIESASEFEAEVTLLSQLDYPGIVKMQDFFAEEGRVYVVLEFVEGQSLRKLVKETGPLSEEQSVEIALSLCDIIEYLHGKNPPIVHRDITPENIIRKPDGSIKLIDFSLALKQDVRNTTDSCGKHAYTPPEQFRDETVPQSDIYALGATIYFLLTGLNPKPLTRSSPRSASPHVSETLNRILERATALDLSERYESITWIKNDLKMLCGSPSDTDNNRVSAEETGVMIEVKEAEKQPVDR